MSDSCTECVTGFHKYRFPVGLFIIMEVRINYVCVQLRPLLCRLLKHSKGKLYTIYIDRFDFEIYSVLYEITCSKLVVFRVNGRLRYFRVSFLPLFANKLLIQMQ